MGVVPPGPERGDPARPGPHGAPGAGAAGVPRGPHGPHGPNGPHGPQRDDTPVGIIRPIPLGEIAGVDDLVDFRPRRRVLRPRRRTGAPPGPRGPSTPSGPSGSSRPRRTSVRRRRRGRVVVRLVLLALVAVVVYVGITFVQVRSTGRSDQARPVDAIVVMGAAQYDGRPSPQLAARLDHAVTLYRDGLAPIVVVTGGKQAGDRFTEAEASAAYLTERGVPDGAIVRENAGRTTYESLAAVADLLEARGLERVLIVTDPFHSLRSRLIAQDVGLTAYVSPTPSSVVTGGAELRHELQEAAGIAIGRIIGLDRI